MTIQKNVHFLGGPPFWSILEHFHDLERIFPKNTRFPVPQPGTAAASQAGATPLAHPRQPRPRPSEDVFGSNTSKYVLGGPGARLARVGEAGSRSWLGLWKMRVFGEKPL